MSRAQKRALKRRRTRRLFLRFAFLALLFFGCYTALTGFLSHVFQTETNVAASPNKQHTVPMQVADITDTHFLELINAEYEISGADIALMPAYRRTSARTDDILLQEDALDAVAALFVAAENVGIDSLYVSSGYRTIARQKELYDEASDKSFIQPPGHSEHHSGLAADIFARGVFQEDMPTSREGRFLAENAATYGLILRYTEEKTAITGISAEAWHFRYVGFPHALYCAQEDLCFEEYIALLQKTGGYHMRIDDKEYHVSYQVPKNDEIYVPAEMSFDVSSDNTGGFIVTSWE